MGQSATFYRIDKSDFQKIIDTPDDFGLLKLTKGFEVFTKSFEGLQFIVSKEADKKKELAAQIFYPVTFIGEQTDFSQIAFENLPDDFDSEQQPLYYHEPVKVSEIADLLDTISLERFQNNFDHIELNRENIYPENSWNDQTGDDIAFNVSNMSIEFQHLKSIFKTAKENEEYLVTYVG